jgi:hypothetical protein
MHAFALGRRQLERAGAFDGNLAALALNGRQADERGVEGE